MSTDNKFTLSEVMAINKAVMRKDLGSVSKLSSESAQIVRRSDFTVQEIAAAFQAAMEHVKTDR
jgi:hypothetical protein